MDSSGAEQNWFRSTTKGLEEAVVGGRPKGRRKTVTIYDSVFYRLFDDGRRLTEPEDEGDIVSRCWAGGRHMEGAITGGWREGCR